MFCPNCHYEYIPGVNTCPDCGVALVYKLPPESAKAPKGPDPSTDSVIVFESESGPDIAIAKEILDEAGIAYIAGRRANISYNERKIAILVSGQDAEQARALLADLAKGSILELPSDFEMEGDSEDKEKL